MMDIPTQNCARKTWTPVLPVPCKTRWRTQIVLILIAAVLPSHADAVCQDVEYFKLNGVVKTQNKYSIIVQTGQGDVPVKLTNLTSVSLKLMRPKINFEQHRLVLELPNSAPDGIYEHNEKIEYPIPDPLYIVARFPHEAQMNQVMKSQIKRLVSYDLSGEAPDQAPVNGDLRISGQLIPGNTRDELRMISGGETHNVILGNRNARLLGFSILDLKPYQTEVFITGNVENGVYFADDINFAPVGDPLTREKPGLPRCLFLGDTISFNYQRPLREALADRVNLHHPPLNCRGSGNWQDIHRWLGVYTEPGREWDAITFNFGLWDDTTPKDEYQENLRNAIGVLRKTNAQLIWVSSTPIDYGFNTDSPEETIIPEEKREPLTREATNLIGKVPGRMRLQNEWAAEVLLDYPEIEICDLWQVVKNGSDSIYKDWWYNKSIDFDYPRSIPLGRSLARHILTALDIPPDRIQPMSAHTVEVEELTDEK